MLGCSWDTRFAMSGILGRDGVDSVQVELSPELLVRLGRDLLVCRKHRAVRQTDGPGDGGRDLHSIAPDRRPHLTQCKHHDDPKAACGSRELAELPMALVKFGVPQGLFITDARISPQAKREFLGDYPNLALEFLDREELVGEILASAVLRALWFDGAKLGLVNARTIFPFLVRRHDGDRPLLPLRHGALRERVFEAVREEARTRGLSAELREGSSERGPFERYRLPRRLTNE
jgi:restriction endonuclease